MAENLRNSSYCISREGTSGSIMWVGMVRLLGWLRRSRQRQAPVNLHSVCRVIYSTGVPNAAEGVDVPVCFSLSEARLSFSALSPRGARRMKTGPNQSFFLDCALTSQTSIFTSRLTKLKRCAIRRSGCRKLKRGVEKVENAHSSSRADDGTPFSTGLGNSGNERGGRRWAGADFSPYHRARSTGALRLLSINPPNSRRAFIPSE